MGKVISWRPTDNREKRLIAQTYAQRLRSMVSYPLRIFLVGSVADFKDRLYSDIDIRVLYSPRYGDALSFRYLAKNLAQKMYFEKGVWIDAKTRGSIPFSFPSKSVLEI